MLSNTVSQHDYCLDERVFGCTAWWVVWLCCKEDSSIVGFFSSYSFKSISSGGFIWTSNYNCFLWIEIYLSLCRGADKCYNRSLCEEHLNLILPSKPPFHPRQFKTCAVVGNSGDLLKTEFGEEIDSHDAVIRDNEAPVNEVS